MVGSARVSSRGVTIATAGLLFVLSQKWVDAITTSLIFGIVLLSIVMVTGFCGQISLGRGRWRAWARSSPPASWPRPEFPSSSRR